MNYPALPTPVAAPPRRHPLRAFRVRWTREQWERDRFGYRRWGHRWYALERPALRLVARLRDSGAEVELDVYGLHHDRSVTWSEHEQDPFA